MTRRRLLPLAPLLLSATLLTACASSAPADPPPTAQPLPAQWQAPLPHQGEVADLGRWWQQFDDPLLAELMDAAQRVSPTLATARTRIETARATRVASRASLLPDLNASASASRGRQDTSLPVANTGTVGLSTAWEIDVFGGNRAGLDAASARLEGARAGWHDARVAVAAEVANAYLGLRACEAQLEKTRADTTSRAETSRLTELAAKAGFQAPANAALTRASAAQGNSLLVAQQAQCDNAVKSLVELTAFDEATLRSRLAANAARLPVPAMITVGTVPADVLNQRPDLYAAARDVEAASADVTQTRAARLPRVSLAGSFARVHVETSQGNSQGTTWSVGPLTVSLPLFDGGTRRANVDAARARYDEAALTYRAKVRGAVREVEQALVQLGSTDARREDARIAADGFDASYKATESLYKGGLASLFDLETSRRNALQAQVNLIDLERERVAAWITLYRAVGGGWTPSSTEAAAATPPSQNP